MKPAETVDSIVARRADFLAGYQNAAYAERYKDLVEANDEKQVRDFFAQKGREYFEKIIQLSVPLPYHSAQQVHQYIASQYALWTPATDIIQLAVDDNPRRLGQYCNWLSYRFSVEAAQ